jgi:hypothetical protein
MILNEFHIMQTYQCDFCHYLYLNLQNNQHIIRHPNFGIASINYTQSGKISFLITPINLKLTQFLITKKIHNSQNLITQSSLEQKPKNNSALNHNYRYAFQRKKKKHM